jgi:AraC-like DNA-binding protein
VSALAFLRSEGVVALMKRAARAAGTPLALHYIERNQEQLRIQSWGGCAACRQVAALPDGKQACRLSRQTASAMAARQGRAIPFVCHLGFGCYSVPALPGEGFVLTFGPFCPASEALGLEDDVQQGLLALDAPPGTLLPGMLDDIHRVPEGTIPAVADWLLDALRAAWAAEQHQEEERTPAAVSAPEAPEPAPRRGRPRGSKVSAYNAAEVAAALAAGDQPQVRALLKAALLESTARSGVSLAVRRARMLAAVSAALEAAERAALPVTEAWSALPETLPALAASESETSLLDAAMKVLGVVRRKAAPRQAPRTDYAALNDLLKDRLVEGLSLDEAATLLGQTPSAISKRLVRNFGMNYSEYVGRLRMEKAKDYLRRTRFSASEVARRVGIADQSNFGKLFRKYEGMTPLEYRQRFGKKS